MVSTRLEQVAAGRAAVVDQQHAIHADAGRPQLGHRARLSLADLRDAVAAGQVEVHVAVAAQDAHRQRRRLAVVQVDPVEGDLLQLLVGRVLVGRADDQLLGLRGPWPSCRTAYSGLLVGTISGLTSLPAFSARSTTAVISLLVVGVQVGGRQRDVVARRRHLGRHHHHVGRLRVGLGQGLFQHEQVLRRADGHQLAVRLGQAQARPA